MPGNASMRVSIRRSIRVGANAGTPLEDLGVRPEHRHLMTRNDLLNGNEDLIRAAAKILAGLPRQSLRVDLAPGAGGGVRLRMTTENIDRLDVYLDDRPVERSMSLPTERRRRPCIPRRAAARWRFGASAAGASWRDAGSPESRPEPPGERAFRARRAPRDTRARRGRARTRRRPWRRPRRPPPRNPDAKPRGRRTPASPRATCPPPPPRPRARRSAKSAGPSPRPSVASASAIANPLWFLDAAAPLPR